ncbi:MAG TPA: peptidylprolyl isomerase [Bacteroidales bacterium]|nr:peptidylprolyl isomerase [Bacteroidales bacterium]
MKTFMYLMLIPLLFKMCTSGVASDDRVLLAKVGTNEIYLDEAIEGMPQGLSTKDSSLYVSQFLKNRIKELLIYDKAVKNIPQGQDIDELVENYRRSLIIYAYQQQVLNEKMQNDITDTEVQVFYENNRDRFSAGHDLIKGIFIKIPKTAPGLAKLKSLYKNSSNEAFSKIENYCVQNGGQFEYFYDHWVILDDILDQISYDTGKNADFLKTHSTFDVVVGEFEYLLYVDDYVLAGSTAPLEYVKDEVRDIVANTRKTEFIHRFEQDLLREAEKKGRITYYNVKSQPSKK